MQFVDINFWNSVKRQIIKICKKEFFGNKYNF